MKTIKSNHLDILELKGTNSKMKNSLDVLPVPWVPGNSHDRNQEYKHRIRTQAKVY